MKQVEQEVKPILVLSIASSIMITTPPRRHNKNSNVRLRLLSSSTIVTLVAALSAFPCINNGALVSAAPSRNLRSTNNNNKATTTKAPPYVCPAGEKMVEVKINTDYYSCDTSWEILDTCSSSAEKKTVVDSGAFVKYQKDWQSSNEVCVAENGRYKFIIHIGGNGIKNDGQFDFDYRLSYDGKIEAETNEFDDYSDESIFGEISCN